jgi:hypothetical protein
MPRLSLFATIAAVSALACLCSCAETKNDFSITGSLPSSGMLNSPYSGTLVAKGGGGGDTWSITGLPDGVTAPVTSGATLAVSGTPTTPGTYSVSATASDVKGDTKTYAVSVIIAGQPLSITPTALGNFTTGQQLSGTTFTASPATQGPYTWTVSGGRLPSGLFLTGDSPSMRAKATSEHDPNVIQTDSPSVTISGTAANSGAYFFTLSVADGVTPTADAGSNAFSGITYAATTACAGAPLARGNESALTQPFAFLVQGTDEFALPIAYAGSFTPDGNGGIAASSVDYESASAGPQSFTVNLAYSSYSYDATGRGCLYLVFKSSVAQTTHVKHHVLPNLAASAGAAAYSQSTHASNRRRAGARPDAEAFNSVPPPAAVTLSFTLDPANIAGGMIEFDDSDGDGSLAAGQIHQQTPSAFSIASLAPNFSFGLTGWYTLDAQMLDRASFAGNYTQSAGTISNGTSDGNIAGSYIGEQTGGTGTLGAISTTTGRGESTYTVDVQDTTLAFQYAYYIINANDYFVISTDSAANVGSFLISGRAIAAPSVAEKLNGGYIAGWSGTDSASGNNYVAIGLLNVDDRGDVSFTTNSNDAGTQTTNTYSGGYDFEGARVTFDGFSGPVAYLTSPGSDSSIAGFLVGTDSFTSSGLLASQNEASDYSNTSLQGPYPMYSAEDISGQAATIDAMFDFDGQGDYEGSSDVSTNGYQQADGPLEGSYTIDSDGSGELAGNIACVTNGSLIFAIDDSSPDPLLYIFETELSSTAAKNPVR